MKPRPQITNPAIELTRDAMASPFVDDVGWV
jgi:hypothetical protein